VLPLGRPSRRPLPRGTPQGFEQEEREGGDGDGRNHLLAPDHEDSEGRHAADGDETQAKADGARFLPAHALGRRKIGPRPVRRQRDSRRCGSRARRGRRRRGCGDASLPALGGRGRLLLEAAMVLDDEVGEGGGEAGLDGERREQAAETARPAVLIRAWHRRPRSSLAGIG
jgi:hypothetical protein